MSNPFEQLVFFHPPWLQPPYQQRQQQTTPRDSVPPRVQIAMQVHAALTAKTAQTPLPTKIASDNEVSFEAMPGQKLTGPEAALLDQCAVLLRNYVQGDLVATGAEKREQRRLDALEKVHEVETNLAELELVEIACPACCNGRVKSPQSCDKCRGQGHVFVPFSRTTEAT